MSSLYRFGVSLEKGLIEKFDTLIKNQRYSNRSEAIRDLIRKELVKQSWSEDKVVAGTISLVFDHHKRQLSATLLDIQHDYHSLILSSQHIHLDHSNCFEVLCVKGKALDVQALAFKLKAQKGVVHCELSMSSTGSNLS